MDAGGLPRLECGRQRGAFRRAFAALALIAAPLAGASAQEPNVWDEYKTLKARDPQVGPDLLEFHSRVERRIGALSREAVELALRLDAEALESEIEGAPTREWWRRAEDLGSAFPGDGPDFADASLDVVLKDLRLSCYTLPRSAVLILRDPRPGVSLGALGALAARARLAAEAIGDGRQASTLDYDWTRALRRAGRGREALDYLEGLSARGPVHPELAPYLDLARVELLRQSGRLREALQALAPLERLPAAQRVQWRIDGLRGHVMLDMGLPDQAATSIRAELEFAEALPRRHEHATRLIAARLYALKHAQAVKDSSGMAAMARRFLDDEEFYAERPPQRAHVQFFLGRAERMLGERDSSRLLTAREHLEAALGSSPEREIQLECRLELARIAYLGGHLDVSSEELANARALVDAWGDPSTLPHTAVEVPALEARIAIARGDAIGALRGRREDLARAFELWIDRWAEEPRWSEGSGLLHYRGRRAMVGAWIRVNLAIDSTAAGIEASLPLLLRAQAQTTLARRHDALPPTLEELRATLLEDGSGLLFYVPDERATHVIAIDLDGIAHEELSDLEQVSKRVNAYRGHLDDARDSLSTDGARTAAVERERELALSLANELLPPAVADRVECWSGIWVVGLDLYGQPPIEWLPLGRERYLGFARPVLHLPSVPLGVALAGATETGRQGQQSALDLLLVVDTLADAESLGAGQHTARLPLDASVRDHLTGNYRDDRVRVLAAEDATRGSLTEELARGARVAQFLVHALRAEAGDAGLVLTPGPDDDGLLWRRDVTSLAGPQLAILLACHTGAGRSRRGDAGSTDMTGAWIDASTRAVIVTSGEIGYATAVRFSGVLHRRLVRGDSIGEAVRRALVETSAEDLEIAPFRYGRLRLVGAGNLSLFAADRTPTAWIVAAALAAGAALLGAAVMFLRRVTSRTAGPRRGPAGPGAG